jgi:hypothetical protein
MPKNRAIEVNNFPLPTMRYQDFLTAFAPTLHFFGYFCNYKRQRDGYMAYH